MDLSSKHQEFEELKARVRRLEEELQDEEVPARWQPTGYYAVYHAAAGFLLGAIGGGVSLLVNLIGAPLVGKYPLQLIRVYLTFPLGEQALQLAEPGRGVPPVNDGMVLAFGCCLYLLTGMVLGIPFQLFLTRMPGMSTLWARLVAGSAFALLLWAIGFYGILAWLQPLLFGGDWIVNGQHLPVWVAAGTHLVFGWTMALVYPLGQFAPYQRPTENS